MTNVLLEKHTGYAIVTLNRPEAMNALNEQVEKDVTDALLEFDADGRPANNSPLPYVLSAVAMLLVAGMMRHVIAQAEIDALAAAGAAVDRIAGELQRGEIPLVGRTEAEVSAHLGRRIIEEGHDKVNFAIVAAGEEKELRIMINIENGTQQARLTYSWHKEGK